MSAAPDAAPRRPPRIGPLKLALFALIPVTIIATVAEVAATLTIERRVRIDTLPSGDRAYVMRIGLWPWSRVSTTPINAHGFPGPELPDSLAPKSCLHVVLAGDSFVYGDGVDHDSAYASIVARDAAARSAPCVRFFNLGERGTTIPRQARRIRETRALLRPDIVILQQYQNDLTDLLEREPRDLSLRVPPPPAAAAGGSRGWGMIQDRLGILNPRAVKFLSYQVFGGMIARGIHRDELRHWSVLADTTRRDDAVRLTAQYASAYDSLAAELAREGIAFGVMIFPSKFDLLAGRFPEESLFVTLAGRHGVPALRIFPLLDRERSPYAFLMYDGHLNEHGNRLVAGAMSEWLFRQEPAPFAALRGPRSP